LTENCFKGSYALEFVSLALSLCPSICISLRCFLLFTVTPKIQNEVLVIGGILEHFILSMILRPFICFEPEVFSVFFCQIYILNYIWYIEYLCIITRNLSRDYWMLASYTAAIPLN